jgi:hypothetical protein
MIGIPEATTIIAANAADVVGLYMAPPENAIVICADEKPSMQALDGRRVI